MGRLSAPLFDIRHGRHVIILDDDMEGYLGIAEGSDDYCVEVYTRKEKCELYIYCLQITALHQARNTSCHHQQFLPHQVNLSS